MPVESFNSLEEMLARQDELTKQANANLHPAQAAAAAAFDKPVFWLLPSTELGCLVYGRAYSYAEACNSSASYMPPKEYGVGDFGDDGIEAYEEGLAEAVYEIRQLNASRARGFLFGQAWSAYYPDPELGSTHVASVWPISELAFAEARDAGWPAKANPLTTPLLAIELVGFFEAVNAGGAS